MGLTVPPLVAAQPETPRKKTRIAICGFSASSIQEVPLDAEEWDVWGINELWRAIPPEKCTTWFDLHSRAWIDANVPAHLSWLQKLTDTYPNLSLYMQDTYPDIPAASPFPKEDLLIRYGHYFTSSIAWMLAFAIQQNPIQIGIWGVDMLHESEYAYQRAGCDYYIGYARGKGIPVYLPDTCGLASSPLLYGYSSVDMDIPKIGERRFRKRKDALQSASTDAMAALHQLDGQLAALHQFGLQITDPDHTGDGDPALIELADIWMRVCMTKEEEPTMGQVAALRSEIARYRQQVVSMVSDRREEALKSLYTADGAVQELGYWQQIVQHFKRGGA